MKEQKDAVESGLISMEDVQMAVAEGNYHSNFISRELSIP